jgi:hypothetical protein
MNSRSRGQPVGCAASRRITKRFVAQWVGLAAAAVIGLYQPVVAQTTTLTTGGVATGAVSCAPSGNGTGHMVCLEYSTAGLVIGLSWQAPPGAATETTGTVVGDSLAQPSGVPVGAPGCGPDLNGLGTTTCLVVSETTSGFALQGIAFYPPTDPQGTGTTTPSGFVTIATELAGTHIGNPSCASANSGGAVVCTININGQLYGVGLTPTINGPQAPQIPTRANPDTITLTASPLTLLLSGASVTGNPSCAAGDTGNQPVPVVCAVKEGNSLVGFALTYTTAAVASEDAISLGSMTFAGDPSCAIPANGQVGTTSFVATCGIVSGTTLFGLSFDPIDAIPASSTSSRTTAFQSLGKAPDTGSWTGSIGCAAIKDLRRGVDPNLNHFPNASPNQNLISCAAISSTDNIFEVTFDPRLPVSRGVAGPFGGNANANLSCLPLDIDLDNTYCGGTTTTGASVGYTLPVGVSSPTTAGVFLRFVSE